VPARAMGLSRQAYDAWRARAQRGPGGPALCRPQLIAEIRAIAAAHQGTYDNPQHDPRAQDDAVCACNPKCMQRLMGKLGIWATTPRRFVRTTRRDEEVPLPDLVGQDFAPGELGRRSVSDSTTSAQVRALLPRHGGR
jgi:putative transposase